MEQSVCEICGLGHGTKIIEFRDGKHWLCSKCLKVATSIQNIGSLQASLVLLSSLN